MRTNNAIERCFSEVRGRTRPMGTFQENASLERGILFHEKRSQRLASAFALHPLRR
jgi:transposase-like protein